MANVISCDNKDTFKCVHEWLDELNEQNKHVGNVNS